MKLENIREHNRLELAAKHEELRFLNDAHAARQRQAQASHPPQAYQQPLVYATRPGTVVHDAYGRPWVYPA